MSDPLSKIRARIRKLRAMTTESGCTEAEAMRAAALAVALMSRHGIGEADLELESASKETAGRRRQPIDGLWSTVACICGCIGYFDRGARLGFTYHGQRCDVLVAEYLHDLLLGAWRRERGTFMAGEDYRRRRKPGTRSAALRAFQEGFVGRVSRRLWQLWWLGREGSGSAVIAAHEARLAQLARRLSADGIRLRAMARLGVAGSRFNDARQAGIAAGSGVAIDPGVGEGQAPAGRLTGTLAQPDGRRGMGAPTPRAGSVGLP